MLGQTLNGGNTRREAYDALRTRVQKKTMIASPQNESEKGGKQARVYPPALAQQRKPVQKRGP